MKCLSMMAGIGLSVVAVAPAFAAENSPAGEWMVQDKTAVVRISKCGGGYCGFVAKGEAGKDYRNPDPAKRNRSLIGIQVLFGMRPSGQDSWSGQTYNADDGQMYAGKISITGPGTLQIEGCAGGGGPCGSQTWTKYR